MWTFKLFVLCLLQCLFIILFKKIKIYSLPCILLFYICSRVKENSEVDWTLLLLLVTLVGADVFGKINTLQRWRTSGRIKIQKLIWSEIM